MIQEDRLMVNLYRVLGKVFYAVAQSDKKVREEEMNTLKKAVQDTWLDVEDTYDVFDTDSARQIEIVFDYLYENETPIEDTLDELKEFKAKNPSLFNKEVNELIMKTAYDIASAVAGRNKSELVFLSQLRKVLES